MKKYIVGMVAVIIAISLSAFTVHPDAAKRSQKNTTTYYWYDADGTDYGVRLGDQAGGIPHKYTKDEAMDEELTLCEDDGSTPCIVGNAQDNAQGTSLDAPIGEDAENYVRRND